MFSDYVFLFYYQQYLPPVSRSKLPWPAQNWCICRVRAEAGQDVTNIYWISDMSLINHSSALLPQLSPVTDCAARFLEQEFLLFSFLVGSRMLWAHWTLVGACVTLWNRNSNVKGLWCCTIIWLTFLKLLFFFTCWSQICLISVKIGCWVCWLSWLV